MTTFVAMLRGINVGGNTLVRMDALRALVSGLGHTDVTTYIQSGNVVFKSRATQAPRVAHDIEARLKSELGLEVTVVIRTMEELATTVRRNPFLPGSDPATLYVIFLSDVADPKSAAGIDAGHFAPDEFQILGREVFARYPNGYGRSKMTGAYFEKALRVRATARNWNTVSKLLQLAQGSAPEK
ncbi:MAG TPA: DUF1697 domain-containing protein [Candidatus Dormibacteraeota bacterium]